jgi:3-oxoacyl-[acyl-carrier protein] reductase
MRLGLEGKTVVVTGGAKGIGREVALAFARHGARVFITYYSDQESAERTSEGARHDGLEIRIVQMDLGCPTSIRAAIQSAVDEWGAIDILVNSAAYIPKQSVGVSRFEAVDDSLWRDWLRVNVEGTLLATQCAIRRMRASGWGRIITLSSTCAIDGYPLFAWYAAGKASFHGLTVTLAREVSQAGILVNVVMPGPTLTARTMVLPTTARYELRKLSALNRILQPEEVASVVLYLGSEANSVITGEIIRLGGARCAT